MNAEDKTDDEIVELSKEYAELAEQTIEDDAEKNPGKLHNVEVTE